MDRCSARRSIHASARVPWGSVTANLDRCRYCHSGSCSGNSAASRLRKGHQRRREQAVLQRVVPEPQIDRAREDAPVTRFVRASVRKACIDNHPDPVPDESVALQPGVDAGPGYRGLGAKEEQTNAEGDHGAAVVAQIVVANVRLERVAVFRDPEARGGQQHAASEVVNRTISSDGDRGRRGRIPTFDDRSGRNPAEVVPFNDA